MFTNLPHNLKFDITMEVTILLLLNLYETKVLWHPKTSQKTSITLGFD